MREAKRKPRVMSEDISDQAALAQAPEPSAAGDEVSALKRRIAQLEKENDALRKQVLGLLEKASRLS